MTMATRRRNPEAQGKTPGIDTARAVTHPETPGTPPEGGYPLIRATGLRRAGPTHPLPQAPFDGWTNTGTRHDQNPSPQHLAVLSGAIHQSDHRRDVGHDGADSQRHAGARPLDVDHSLRLPVPVRDAHDIPGIPDHGSNRQEESLSSGHASARGIRHCRISGQRGSGHQVSSLDGSY